MTNCEFGKMPVVVGAAWLVLDGPMYLKSCDVLIPKVK